MNDEQITIGMASIPSRMAGMLRVVQDLLPACDHFDLYLNNYPAGFQAAGLDDPKITVFRGMADIGARGKLYMAHRTPGYFLTVDDDLIYPSDYVYKMVQTIEKYKREAVIGGHGTLLGKSPDPMQPNPRVLYSHQGYVPTDMLVHILGTGVCAWHTSTVEIDWRAMEPGKIDEQFALACQRSRVPQICLAHPGGWVKEDDNLKFRDCLRRNMPAGAAALQRQQRHTWEIYIPASWKLYQQFQ